MTQLNLALNAILGKLLGSLDEGIAIFDAEHKLVYANNAMVSVTGNDPSDIGSSLENLNKKYPLRTKTGALLAPSDFPAMRAYAGEKVQGEQYVYIDPSGHHRWLSVSCRSIMDENGALQYMAMTVADISTHKSCEEKLHFMMESAKILSLNVEFRTRLKDKIKLTVPALADWCAIDVLNVAGDIERIAIIHQDQQMIDYCFASEKRFPSTKENPNGAHTVIRSGVAQFVPVFTDEMMQQSARSPEHLETMRHLGITSLIIIPIAARGKVLGSLSLGYAESGRAYTQDDFNFFREFCSHLGFVFDNSRLYEEISKRDKAKDLFIASLSHELRNPLAPIRSALDLLKLRETTFDVREELKVIEHQFEHFGKLLDDLLDVARFTQAKIVIVPSTLEFGTLVEQSLKASDALLRTSHITLHFTHSSAAPLPVWADATRLEQAITNLMNNAVKFTPSGGSIWVDLSKEDEYAVLKIRDNGEGIDPADLPNIFELYYQGPHSSNTSGLGIGLLLVRKIIDLHRGSIAARSEGKGMGSEFVIKLPLTDVLPSASERDTSSASHGKHKILVVDDNVQAAELLVKLLNILGNRATAVYSGDEALAHNTLSGFDIILLDIGMPNMNGYEVVRALRARGIAIPILALTGYGLAEDKQKALDAGFTAHLTKPIGIKELQAAFTEFLPTPMASTQNA